MAFLSHQTPSSFWLCTCSLSGMLFPQWATQLIPWLPAGSYFKSLFSLTPGWLTLSKRLFPQRFLSFPVLDSFCDGIVNISHTTCCIAVVPCLSHPLKCKLREGRFCFCVIFCFSNIQNHPRHVDILFVFLAEWVKAAHDECQVYGNMFHCVWQVGKFSMHGHGCMLNFLVKGSRKKINSWLNEDQKTSWLGRKIVPCIFLVPFQLCSLWVNYLGKYVKQWNSAKILPNDARRKRWVQGKGSSSVVGVRGASAERGVGWEPWCWGCAGGRWVWKPHLWPRCTACRALFRNRSSCALLQWSPKEI